MFLAKLTIHLSALVIVFTHRPHVVSKMLFAKPMFPLINSHVSLLKTLIQGKMGTPNKG